MTRNYNRIFAYPTKENAESYIFVDAKQLCYFSTFNRSGFNAIAFPCKTWKNDSNIYGPIICDNFTVTSWPFTKFETMEEIQLSDVPPAIKRRFNIWAKLQS